MHAASPRQLALALPAAQSFAREALLEDGSNAEALRWLDRPAAWPGGRLLLWGPAGTGKTHLLHAAAGAHGWRVLEGPFLRGLPPAAPAGGTILDDADCVPDEETLLHLLNLVAERGERLLLAARTPPSRWGTALPDLDSRLRATAAVAIARPGDALLGALLAKHFAGRGLRVDPAVRDWLLARLPREAAAVAEAAARLDRAALALGVPVTRALARATLGDWEGFAPDEARDGLAPDEARDGLASDEAPAGFASAAAPGAGQPGAGQPGDGPSGDGPSARAGARNSQPGIGLSPSPVLTPAAGCAMPGAAMLL